MPSTDPPLRPIDPDAFRRRVHRRAARLRRVRSAATAGTLCLLVAAVVIGLSFRPTPGPSTGVQAGRAVPASTVTSSPGSGRQAGSVPATRRGGPSTTGPQSSSRSAPTGPGPGHAVAPTTASSTVPPRASSGGAPTTTRPTPPTTEPSTTTVTTTQPTPPGTAGSVPAGCGEPAQRPVPITASALAGTWMPCSGSSVFGASRGIEFRATTASGGTWTVVNVVNGRPQPMSTVAASGTWFLTTASVAPATPGSVMLHLAGGVGTSTWAAVAEIAAGPPARLHVTSGSATADYELFP